MWSRVWAVERDKVEPHRATAVEHPVMVGIMTKDMAGGKNVRANDWSDLGADDGVVRYFDIVVLEGSDD